MTHVKIRPEATVQPNADMRDQNLSHGGLTAIGDWAARNKYLSAIWLNTAEEAEIWGTPLDVELAVMLAPVDSGFDEALDAYFTLGERWRSELARLVGQPIRLGMAPRLGAIKIWSAR